MIEKELYCEQCDGDGHNTEDCEMTYWDIDDAGTGGGYAGDYAR